MIKILFFIETLNGGGAAKVLINLVNAMDQTVFSITVQTLFRENVEKLLVPGIQYRYCYKKKNVINRIIMRVENAADLVYKLHIKERCDIECAYLESISTKILSTSKNTKALKCAWIHCDLERASHNPKEYAAKTLKWYSKFDKVICVSESIQKSALKMYGDAIDSNVIYNTVNEKEILQKSGLSLPSGTQKRRLTVLTVGTLYPPKNHMRLLRAYKKLFESGICFDLWILGEGPERGRLEQFIRDNDLQENVHLLGFNVNPYPFIKNADLLVCSSNYEGFSTFITEGLILGKPIVTTDCSGMRELLGNCEYGLITANNDEAFYAGVKRMLTEPGLIEHYAEKAKMRGKEFTCEKLTQEAEHYLSQMLFEKRQHQK